MNRQNNLNYIPELGDSNTIILDFNKLKSKGVLVNDYHPFHNLRLHEPKFEYDKGLYSLKELEDIFGITATNNNKVLKIEDILNSEFTWKQNGKQIPIDEEPVLRRAGELVDFDTNQLKFNINDPVDLLPLYSYDGSVNLIVTTANTYPKLINSRFSPTSKREYLIVDRKGNNDTNIYDEGEEFVVDTSLYKNAFNIVKVDYIGETSSGNLKIGNYHFYFRYSDDDGNQSDFIAETGLISIFRGNTPQNICTGFADLNSYKGIQIKLSNLDLGYSYVDIYYSRSSADINENPTITYFKIDLKFPISNDRENIYTITGFEETIGVASSDINPVYQVFEGVGTQATALNMLFFGNVKELSILHQQLENISLAICPEVNTEEYDITSKIKSDYRKKSDFKNSYYNSNFIYDKTGYWPDELYRFGIVYIFENNVLSPVFNVRGIDGMKDYSLIDIDEFSGLVKGLNYDSDTYFINNTTKNENVKGVVRFPKNSDTKTIYSVKFNIQKSDKVRSKLQELGVIGYFFVRQKRIPTILCLAFTIGVDNESRVPAIPYNNKYYIEGFLQRENTAGELLKTTYDFGNISAKDLIGNSVIKRIKKDGTDRLLVHSYDKRIQEISNSDINLGAICPEYDVNSPYFNSLFTGAEFPIDILGKLSLERQKGNKRSYYSQLQDLKENQSLTSEIIGVEDGIKLVAIGDTYFSSRAGEAEEVFRFEYIGFEDKTTEATNLVRGLFGPYIGLGLKNPEYASQLIQIRIPNYDIDSLSDYFDIRFNDKSSYYAISERKEISNLDEEICYRGDCFICQFTHRVNRNFNDPVAPTNDKILDPKCWRDNFEMKDSVLVKDNLDKINLGDVNAILLGQWITFVCRSKYNLNIRSIDESWITEKQLFGNPRAFYPYREMLVSGNNKIPEALCYNKGFQKTVSERFNFEVPDVPALKDDFTNRISYSDINVTDSFKNGFRTFIGGHYRDYPKTYGSITKLVETNGNLLCIFEHGIGVIAVNERAVAAEGSGGYAYINTHNVLPENPNIISDTYGSQWKDSIIKTLTGAIYGVDTVAKKIWKVSSGGFELLSDFKVNQFLNHNISLAELEVNPIIGIRNVKTHYNANKQDVIFTFYDNLESGDEKVWSLCYNEMYKKFITFYSWLPSFSENIDNQYFSFNWGASHYIAKLGLSVYGNEFSNCICVNKSIIDPSLNNLSLNLHIDGKQINMKTCKLKEDRWDNYKKFTIVPMEKDGENTYILKSDIGTIYNITKEHTSLESTIYRPVLQLIIEGTTDEGVTYTSTITLTTKDIYIKLLTDFWKHGKAGIIDIQDEIKPTHWYGKQHPFEFEFVVNENAQYHKIFDNLQIISNNAEPESFHYEIVGDAYSFANDKENMYIRQEATKHALRENGLDISYNEDYTKLKAKLRNISGLPIDINEGEYGDKSTLFPIYYNRIDNPNTIEDYYHLKDGFPTKDFSAMAGAEITRDNNLNEYRIWNHTQAVDIKENRKGRLRGNMHYREDKWYVQINPINLVQKNELKWVNNEIPIELGQQPIPGDVQNTIVKNDGKFVLPNKKRTVTTWDYNDSDNLEVKPKDKWMKVRIRYKGDKLAIINAVMTLYSISMS